MFSRNLMWLTCCLISSTGAVAFAASGERPNIIVILADDMGYADAGFTGSEDILTPNLDELAASGVTFTMGYCNHPFCGPSRAALLSGRYQQRFGFEDNPANDPFNTHLGIDPGEKLFPKRLQEVGYETGGIGKWHLGAAAPFHPNNRGFDYFYGFLGGGHDYFEIDTRKPVHEGYFQPLIRNGQPAAFAGYLTTALSQDAVKFVESNKEKPFFLYLSYNAPHMPLQAPAEAIARYAHIKDKKRRVYAAMVDVMDQGIGSVMQALQRTGLRDNTLVFFLSDNGGPQPMSWGPDFGNDSSNGKFRGGKTNLYEGGIHVPFVASWPGHLPAGKKFDAPVIAIDIARTAVECAGADALAAPEMEGVNLLPFVRGELDGVPHETLFWRDKDGARWATLSSDLHKHVQDKIGGKPELFYLPTDISETNDLADRESELATALRKQWAKWDELNIAGRIGNYLEYIEARNRFFVEAIPEKARQEGYPGLDTK